MTFYTFFHDSSFTRKRHIDGIEIVKDLTKAIYHIPKRCDPVKIINLRDKKIKELNFEILKSNIDIDTLYLDRNKLEDLPSELKNLTKIESLSFRSNKFKKFPNVIFELKNLEKIYCTNNKIEDIPDDFNKISKLNHIELGENRIKQIPDSLCELKELWLDLRFHKLSSTL